MKKLSASLIFFCFIFISCRSPFGKNKYTAPKPVAVQYTSQSPANFQDYFSLTIDSLDNYLLIKFVPTKNITAFPFPIDKSDNKGGLLSHASFSFTLFYNNIPLGGGNLPRKTNTYFGYNTWLGKNINYVSDTMDLYQQSPIEFKIPFYAFNKLKAGVRELELQCFQNIFCSGTNFKKYTIDSVRKDTSTKYIRHYANVSSISFKAKFKINVPQIFKTSIYCYGIQLRNDSVYSPAGMDNTIWNSSYPDIYWTISYPNQEFYCSSDYQTSTALYDTKDTFHLYHYTPYDSISLGVWDHDNLSRDDYISYQKFSLKQFPNNKIAKLRFDNVKCFELRMVKGYAVNR